MVKQDSHPQPQPGLDPGRLGQVERVRIRKTSFGDLPFTGFAFGVDRMFVIGKGHTRDQGELAVGDSRRYCYGVSS